MDEVPLDFVSELCNELDNRMKEFESGNKLQWAKKTRAPIVFSLVIDSLHPCLPIVKPRQRMEHYL